MRRRRHLAARSENTATPKLGGPLPFSPVLYSLSGEPRPSSSAVLCSPTFPQTHLLRGKCSERDVPWAPKSHPSGGAGPNLQAKLTPASQQTTFHCLLRVKNTLTLWQTTQSKHPHDLSHTQSQTQSLSLSGPSEGSMSLLAIIRPTQRYTLGITASCTQAFTAQVPLHPVTILTILASQAFFTL